MMKGFSYWDKFSNESLSMYKSDLTHDNGFRDQISLYHKDCSLIVMLTTTDKEYYLKITDSLNAAGYKYLYDEPKVIMGDNLLWLYYSNDIYTATVYTSSAPDQIFWYTIQLNKNL